MAMFENISEFFKRFMQSDKKELLAENPTSQSKDTAKDRLHIVLMQDRANVSADFLELMKEEIIEVIKKYIVVDESKIDVRLTNEENEDGSLGAPLLHANIPILNVRNDLKGTYMNGEPSDKIEGQQEISLEENREEIFEKEPQEPLGTQEPQEVQKTHESQEEKIDTVVPEQKVDEKPIEEKTETNHENSNPEENKPREDIIEPEENGDEMDEEDDDDDDVTFDDLLKAAEEEEKRLKQLQEKKEDRGDHHKKKTIQKKKKTSK